MTHKQFVQTTLKIDIRVNISKSQELPKYCSLINGYTRIKWLRTL